MFDFIAFKLNLSNKSFYREKINFSDTINNKNDNIKKKIEK